MAGFSVRRGAVDNTRGRAGSLFPQGFSLPDPGPLPHGQMEINGIRFPIDPQGISVFEENQNHAFQTLRTRESTKVRSGHGRINITVRAIFTGVSVGLNEDNSEGASLSQINDTLMPILYSLKKMPLCFIDNELIRRSVPVVSGEDEDGNLIGETIGAFIKAVRIGTVPGLPHAVSAEFQLVWYNHRPFAPRLRFRKSWIDGAGKVARLRSEYQKSNERLSSRSTARAIEGTRSSPPAGNDIAKGHPGRLSFIQNFGNPATAFNATAYHTYTESIHQARPLLEYLWPYRYESSNPAVSGNQQVADIERLPPFEMQSFDQAFDFGFTVMRQPDSATLNFIVKELDLRTSAAQKKELTKAKREKRSKFGSLPSQPRTGPMTRAEVAEYASELGVHPDVLLAAIILWTENRLKHRRSEQRLIVHSVFNNAIRTGGDVWNYAVGARKLTGIQGRGKEFRRYGSSVVPTGENLGRAIDLVKSVLKERAEEGESFQKVTNFVHASTQNKAHKRSVEAIERWQIAYKDWERAGATGKPPKKPAYVKSAAEVDASWTNKGRGLNRITVPGLSKKRILAYRTRSSKLGAAAIRDHAEERLRETPPQRNVGIADVININLRDAADVVASSLGLLDAPHGPNGSNIEKIEQEITSDRAIASRKEIRSLLDLAKGGWRLLINEVTNKPALVNDVSISIPEDSSSVIPTSINVGFGTNLAMMPLEGHRFPTVQYTGGQHTSATVSFRVEGKEGREFVSDFKALVNSDEEAAIHFREFAKRKGITIRNSMLNSLGMKAAFLEAMSVDTVPGNPEGLNVTIRLVDATLNERMPALLVGKDEVSIEDITGDALKLILEKKWIDFKFEGGYEIVESSQLKEGQWRYPDEELTAPEIVVKDQFRAFEKNYGLERFDSELKRLREKVKEQRLLNEKRGEIQSISEILLGIEVDARSKNPNSSLALTTGIVANLRRPDEKTKPVRRGMLFVVPRKIKVTLTKKGSKSIVQRDLQRLVEYIRLKIGSGNFKINPRVDVLDFHRRSSEITGAGTKPISEYIGYGGAQIDSKVEIPELITAGFLGTADRRGLIQSAGFRALMTNITGRMIAMLGIAEDGGQPRDADFAVLAARMGDMLEFNPGHVAYPDLMLPPNPITGLVADTFPDFFLYNDSDVKLSNSNLAKVIFGADTASLPKEKGLRIGKYAIQNAIRGIQDVYGASNSQLPGPGIRPAHEGRDGIYLSINKGEDGRAKHETVTKKGEAIRLQDRLPPDKNGALISNPKESPLVFETDISARFSRSQLAGANTSESKKRQYSRSKALGFHLQNSVHRKEFDVENPRNLNRVSQTHSKGEYERIFKEFGENYSSEHYAVRRSFPTFKVMFIEENNDLSSSENPLIAKLSKTYALDDFYGVNSIKEIRIVKNKDMAADVCLIQLLDLDGVLYNRKYLPPNDSFGLRKTKSKEQRNPFLDTIIKEGMKVVVKFGYSNDPSSLETMFVGQVVNWEGSHLIEITCQSYGTELVAKRFGTHPSKNADFWNVTTDDLLHDMLDREEVRHFGRWRLADVSLTGGLLGVEKLRPDGKVKKVWTWKPSVVDDNLYIPDYNTYASTIAKVFGDLEYVFFDTTIWDVFKEMELRHPGHIAYPVPYGNGSDARMTMFFGHPSMPYLARPAADIEEIESEIAGNNINTVEMRDTIVKVGRELGFFHRQGGQDIGDQAAFALGLEKLLPENPDFSGDIGLAKLAELTSTDVEDLQLAAPSARGRLNKLRALLTDKEREKFEDPKRNVIVSTKPFDSIPSDKFWAATQYFQDGRIRPFRNYELVTSMHDILLNNIRADHRGTFNSVELRYSDNNVDFGDFAQGSNVESMCVNADDNIKDHHIRRTIENWPNCTNSNLARRYASQLLANSLKGTYKGELLTIGKPQLKPYDIIWLYDNYSDMAGPIEVQEVVHTISSETGFVTEIVPHMIVTVKEAPTILMADAIGAFFNEHLKEFTNGALMGLSGGVITGLAKKLLSPQVLIKGAIGVTPVGVAAEVVQSVNGEVLNPSKSPSLLLEGAGLLGMTGGIGIPLAAVAMEQSARAQGRSVESQKLLGTTEGVLAGVGATALWAINPIIPCAAGIAAGALLYKLLKYNATREPIIITPLIKQGKPYVTGLEGMESDGLLVTDLLDEDKRDAAYEAFSGRKWRYFYDGIDDAGKVLEVGWANWMAQR